MAFQFLPQLPVIVPLHGFVCIVIPYGEYARVSYADPSWPTLVEASSGCFYTVSGYAQEDVPCWYGFPGKKLHEWPPGVTQVGK